MVLIIGSVSLTTAHINELGQNCDCEIILSFDMSREVFQIMRLPDEMYRKLRYPVDRVSSTQRNKVFSVFNVALLLLFMRRMP